MDPSMLPGFTAGGGITGPSALSGGNPFQGHRGALEFNFGGSKFGAGHYAIIGAVVIGLALILKR